MKTRRITLETHLHKIAEYDETVKIWKVYSIFRSRKLQDISALSLRHFQLIVRTMPFIP